MKSILNIRLLSALVCAAGAVSTGFAAEESLLSTNESEYLPWDKGAVRLGGFVAVFNSSISFGLNNSPGVNIDAEDFLGLQSTLTVFRVDAMYRPGKSRRNELDFSYAGYHRSGEATLSRDLTIGDITYPIGAHVSTVFDFDLIEGTYSYAFVQSERVRLALGLGIYAVPLKYGLHITTSGGRSDVEGGDTTVPLPALALRTEFQVLPKLYLDAGVDAMYLEISNFRGSLINLNVGTEYRPWKHLGLGLGYSYMGVNVDAESSSSDYPGANFVGNVNVHFSGLLMYGKLSF